VSQFNHAGFEKHLCRCKKIQINFKSVSNAGLIVGSLLCFIVVLPQARTFQLDAIKDNFEKTGKCGLQMAGDCFLSLPVTFALQKHNPYTNTINKG
jgi:hypothetical protein